MAFRTGDGLEVNGILVVDAGGNIESVPSVAINQAKSAMDTTNLKLEVNGNASIRGANALFFGVATNSYNSWKTKIWNNNTSTMYVNAQEFNVNNAGYGSVTFLKANASGVDGAIFRDINDTNYYVHPGDTTQSAKFRQHVSIGDGGNTTNSGSWGARLNLTDSVHSKIEVGQDANSVNSHWYAHTGQDSIKFGTSTAHDVEFQRGGTTRLELTSDSITFSGSINMNGHNIRRGNHHTGHLEGSYNNIGGNGSKSNPIYTIGSSYNPAMLH